jgi:hypothetical protein
VTSPTHRTEPTHMTWPDKPMPDPERRLLTTLSAGVWLIALAMNVSHVYDHLGQKDIQVDDTRRAVLCLAPDVLLLIGVWKLRYRARSAVAWAMVGTGLAWLAWSALSTAQASPSAWMLAIAPIGVAVLTTLALEFKHAPEPPGESPAPAPVVDAQTEPAPLLPPQPDPATDVASTPEPPAPREGRRREDAGVPTREAGPADPPRPGQPVARRPATPSSGAITAAATSGGGSARRRGP